jgi:dolichol-phosphate mannosyltransferase
VTEPAAPELTIVMPVFNEGVTVVPILRALEAAITTPHETLVVHDFDEDSTVPPVRALAAELHAVRLLRNDLGRGVLNAMKAGFMEARGSWVLVTMADGSDDPAVVEPMLALARGGADVVAASRYMRGGHQHGGPVVKRTLSRAAGLSLHWLGGIPVHDTTNNFKLYGRRFLDATTIESTAGFELATELTVKAALGGWSLAEVPATWRDRTSGTSNFRLRAWLPHYLHWYRVALAGRARRLFGRQASR